MSNDRRGTESSSSSGVERVTVVTKTKKKFRFEAQNGQLLPGLPNDITLDKIAPKLSWRLFHILSSVSRSWKEAIESHQVHDARVHSHSTETLVVLHHRPSWDSEAIAFLFSTRDHSCYQLPPIPGANCWIQRGCDRGHWISWGSKIYVVVAMRDALETGCMLTTAVYVLDLAGKRGWKQCASMREERHLFACGVVGGKIYAFGGTSDGYPVCGSEVYDPDEDAWSPLTRMISWRFGHQVATAGEKLLVYGGMFYDPLLLDVYEHPILELGTIPSEPVHDAAFLEIYRPMADEWEIVEPFVIPTSSTLVFMAQGKLHRITCDGIDVHQIDRNEWTTLHSNSFTSIEELTSVEIQPVSVLVANRELLLFVYWYTSDLERFATGHTFLQSKGFGSQKKEIVWEKVACSFSVDTRDPFVCSVEL